MAIDYKSANQVSFGGDSSILRITALLHVNLLNFDENDPQHRGPSMSTVIKVFFSS